MFLRMMMCLLLCLCLCASTCAMAGEEKFTFTHDPSRDAIVKVTGNYEAEEMVIPFIYGAENLPIYRFEADLSAYHDLKYILFDGENLSSLPKADLTSAENLEVVYVTFEITEENLSQIKDRLTLGSGVEIHRFYAIDSATLTVMQDGYDEASTKVTIRWNDLSPDARYTVTRTIGDETEIFDSNRDVSLFMISNGDVTFTDIVEPAHEERTYQYTIAADAPFCEGIQSRPGSIVIPASEPDAPPAAAIGHPSTGDGTPLGLLFALTAASAACVIALRKKRFSTSRSV